MGFYIVWATDPTLRYQAVLTVIVMAYSSENVSSVLLYVISACLRSISIITVLFLDIGSAMSSAQWYSCSIDCASKPMDQELDSQVLIPAPLYAKVIHFT